MYIQYNNNLPLLLRFTFKIVKSVSFTKNIKQFNYDILLFYTVINTVKNYFCFFKIIYFLTNENVLHKCLWCVLILQKIDSL